MIVLFNFLIILFNNFKIYLEISNYWKFYFEFKNFECQLKFGTLKTETTLRFEGEMNIYLNFQNTTPTYIHCFMETN